ncbi:putative P-loop containing nucleoside triphosphate hydrolase, leucine-rich repeat domain superfamily [Helianthus annuus]|uniref:P-loop containing nucleoside triphosphate hydrolase, leucine-rich repeat domain superfamily n=1 Tax=Helianthus annuus TaxID=4232 RepID=A0A9K3J4J9_HELAN|nr:putative P-loop containing nucleoside triphosphate hydrolase, leucine-rich repeat domain superfamily [Helianthus annuus]
MEPRLKDLEKSLDITSNDVRMIGIKGMGGAGKTTLARAVFDRISVHFEAKSFVENVREVSKASLLSGLLSLQRKILSDLLNGQGNNVGSVHDGKNMLKTKLRGRKVLVVLDDVDHQEQLEALAGDLNWFKPGSRIIITTRDEQVLIAHRVEWIRDVSLLSHEEAIGLFSRHAFGKDLPIQEYEKESQQVVQYAVGLPLTIKVLGSFLFGKDKLEWESALARLKRIPLKETLEKLELCYESLEDDYKEIFLDVACILKWWKKNEAIRMLESCGFQARIGLRVLEQRSLITFHDYGFGSCLSMHDHIEEMGKNIVRRLHLDEPYKHSRLWIQEEIEDLLDNDLGSEATRCIRLNVTPGIVLKGLGNLKKLKCLFVDHSYEDRYVHVNIDEVSQYFPNSLRYLKWNYYPHWCLPKTFQANNLVELHMSDSRIKQLWVGGKVLTKLKSIILRSSKVRTLDLGLTPNLVRLDLSLCGDLVELHVPVRCLKRLTYLNLSHCTRLKSVLFIKDLESLEFLHVSGLHIKEFEDIILCHSNSNLQELSFDDNDIENLPSSIGNLHKLVMLSFESCDKLKSLPGSICSLQHLRLLKLVCCGIEELPEDIGQLECLEELDLSHSKIKHLPDSICKLKHLKTLFLGSCKVCKLPEDVGQIDSLSKLDLTSTKIRDIPPSICKLKHLKFLNLSYCSSLEKLRENLGDLESLDTLVLTSTKIRDIPPSICKLKHLKFLNLSYCSSLEKLPENLGDLESLDTLVLTSTKIRDIPPSICKLKHLKFLNLSYCSSLEKLPENLGDLESLDRLDLTSTKIRDFPSSICKLKHLKYLGLSNCSGLEKLPENLGDLESLNVLYLRSTKIRDVPPSICKLKHLKELYLSNCSGLEKLPENLGDLESLNVLYLTSTKIRDVPSSICKLKHLKYLYLSNCSGLEKLPQNLGDLESLNRLDLTSTKIRDVPPSICKLKHLKELYLSNCSGLEKLPENLGDLESLYALDLMSTPISHLPDSISLLKGLRIIGYKRRIDPDAILFQEEQHITFAPKRRRANTEATTSDAGDRVKDGGSLMRL